MKGARLKYGERVYEEVLATGVFYLLPGRWAGNKCLNYQQRLILPILWW